MKRCSYFIPNKALFGSFPSQEEVIQLENEGVRYFINLTKNDEKKIVPYQTVYPVINYPIEDRHVPLVWGSFAQLIIKICHIIYELPEGEKLYIHCKGGHGRSGIVVACVLSYYYDLTTFDALKKTAEFHSQRVELREKWRKMSSPQNYKQREFVHRFFFPIKFSKNTSEGLAYGFNNNSHHTVEIEEKGTFKNAFFAFQSYHSDNPEYLESLLNGVYRPDLITKEEEERWQQNKIEYMSKVLELKFEQHEELKKNIMNTGLRDIIKLSNDSFWGCGEDSKGENIHGKLLKKLRDRLLLLC